jgi:hypothetical protein
MNANEFVKLIKEYVLDSTVSSVQSTLSSPPGRSPSKDILEMANWYNSIGESDKEMVANIIRKTARDAIFGFFCVLDGVRPIERTNKGELKLYYEREDEYVLLNDQSKINLHELI